MASFEASASSTDASTLLSLKFACITRSTASSQIFTSFSFVKKIWLPSDAGTSTVCEPHEHCRYHCVTNCSGNPQQTMHCIWKRVRMPHLWVKNVAGLSSHWQLVGDDISKWTSSCPLVYLFLLHDESLGHALLVVRIWAIPCTRGSQYRLLVASRPVPRVHLSQGQYQSSNPFLSRQKLPLISFSEWVG